MPKPAKEKLHLPAANEFSPGQVGLGRVLDLVAENEGDREAIVEAIRGEFFAASARRRKDPVERLKQQRTRANNVLIGMKGYGLFSLKTNTLTEIGRRLLDEKDEHSRVEEFATHILKSRHGLDVVQAVTDMQDRGERVTKETLAAELRRRGFTLPRATTHHTKLIQWLRLAGVINKRYEVDREDLGRLSGISPEAVSELTGMTSQQRAFLQTLRRMAQGSGKAAIAVKTVIDHAIIEHGAIFKEDQLRAQVFSPLEKTGWISMSRGAGGRGGKSGTVSATDKLLDTDIEALTGVPFGEIPSELWNRLNQPIADIYADLESNETYTKGIALELLALRMVLDLNLSPLLFRVRSNKTGGAEVDLIAEGAHLVFSRWLVQCKNIKGSVTLNALVKEVGMAVLLQAQVVVVATTGQIGRTMREFADKLARTTPLQVVLVDGDLLKRYIDQGPQVLLEFVQRSATETLRKKRSQVQGAEDAVQLDDEGA